MNGAEARRGRLADKVAIITGAGSGIGRATAQRFAEEEATVVINDLRDDRLQATLSGLPGREHEVVAGDISKEETARALTKRALDRFGRIDVLVNNAGIYFIQDITASTDAEIDRVLDINVKSMIWCIKHVIPVMVKQQSGAIVNLSSISAYTGQEHEGQSQYLYNMSKAAALQLAISMGTRYARDGIRVNAVCPGVVRTGLLREQYPDLTAEDEEKMWSSIASTTVPQGRVQEPEEIASAILFLASSDASIVTGTALVTDGGYLAR